jgi:hypothetical protein
MRTLSTARPWLRGAMVSRGAALFLLVRVRVRVCVRVGVGVGLVGLLVPAACAKKQDDTQPAATPTATSYPGYPPPQGTYAQPYPGQYPAAAPTATYGQPPVAPAPPAAPAPVPAPTGAATAGGPMAVPGPLAFQCQNDVPCGTHHCNVQYGKCAFPCQSAADCISPAQCLAGLCIFPVTPPH